MDACAPRCLAKTARALAALRSVSSSSTSLLAERSTPRVTSTPRSSASLALCSAWLTMSATMEQRLVVSSLQWPEAWRTLRISGRPPMRTIARQPSGSEATWAMRCASSRLVSSGVLMSAMSASMCWYSLSSTSWSTSGSSAARSLSARSTSEGPTGYSSVGNAKTGRPGSRMSPSCAMSWSMRAAQASQAPLALRRCTSTM
mmetsp:Transcript_1377/g.3064  ORF Transcript_1377/g.3064 Transcript_1377/m.3064 type:complete len:202 (+) Transcript_1377:332-937(+)